MAELQELRALFNHSDLTEKVEAAIIIAANDLISGVPTAAEQSWAAEAFRVPGEEAAKALMAVLADNSALSVAQILAATDSAIKTNVAAVVPTLVVAHTG